MAVGENTTREDVKVTVAICTWNRSTALRRTLEALGALRIPSGTVWELLVVNNNCTDDTDSVVSSFVGRLPVRLLHETTPGLSYARNLVLEVSTGEVVLWTDDDVVVDPGWLEAMLTGICEYEADFVFGRSVPEWPGNVPSWYSRELSGAFALLDYGETPFVVSDRAKHFFGLNFGGTVEAHRQLGGFRTAFGVKEQGGGLGEDVDMFERAFDTGMTIAYLPHSVVAHVISEERTRKRYHRRRQWVSLPVYYEAAPELFPGCRMLLGLPRFFFGWGVRAIVAYGDALLRRAPGRRFRHELEIVRFVGLLMQAARHGFRHPSESRRKGAMA